MIDPIIYVALVINVVPGPQRCRRGWSAFTVHTALLQRPETNREGRLWFCRFVYLLLNFGLNWPTPMLNIVIMNLT